MTGSTTLSIFSITMLAPALWQVAEHQRGLLAAEFDEKISAIQRLHDAADIANCTAPVSPALSTATLDVGVLPTWQRCALFAGVVVEVIVGIFLLFKYGCRRPHSYQKESGISDLQNEVDDLLTAIAASKEASAENKVRIAEENAALKGTASKRLVAENAALRNAVEAVWRGDSVDILDFEFGSKDPPGSSSDESTCSDKQLSSLYPSSVCSRLSISSRMDTPSASSDDGDHSEVMEVQSQDCVEDDRLEEISSATCSSHEDELEAPAYTICRESKDIISVDVNADLAPANLIDRIDEPHEPQDSLGTTGWQCGDGDEPEASAADICFQFQDLTEVGLTEVDDAVEPASLNTAISEHEPEYSKDEPEDSVDTICALCGDFHEDESGALAHKISAQSQDFAVVDDVADLPRVSFVCRGDDLPDSKHALRDSTDAICAHFGDGHADELEASSLSMFAQSPCFTEAGNVVDLTPDELQDATDERQESADAICASCGDVHVFGRPAWCRSLN